MRTRLIRSISIIAAVALGAIGVSVVIASPASATVSFSVTPSFPSPTTVGATNVPASLAIENTSTFPDSGPQAFRNVTMLPSCNPGGLLGSCAPDPGTFKLSSTATGRSGTACSEVSFNIVVSPAGNPGGQVRFVPPGDDPENPATQFTLGAAGTANDTCVIDFTFTVVKPPANGSTTQVTASVDAVSGGGTSTGSQTVTVNTPPFVPITPSVRAVDTRPGFLDSDGFNDPLGAATEITVPMAGNHGLPNSGIAAVALNITVTQPTQPSFLTVYPSTAARPVASNSNFVPFETKANSVVVGVGGAGSIKIYNSIGNVHVIVDIQGWIPTGQGYNPLTPARILDTRPGELDSDGFNAALGPNGSIDVPVLNRGGVPGPPGNTNVGSVVLTVTAVNPSTGGHLTVWPTGQPRPNASIVNFPAGRNVPNIIVVKVGTDGKVSVFNASGVTDVIFDVVGWFPLNPPTGIRIVTPARILDTRPGQLDDDGYNAALGTGHTIDVLVAGKGGLPAGGIGTVVLNVTVTQPDTSPSGGGHMVIFPTGGTFPPTSSINFVTGQTVANVVFAKVGTDGKVSLHNAFGTSHAIFDVLGWFPNQ